MLDDNEESYPEVCYARCRLFRATRRCNLDFESALEGHMNSEDGGMSV